VRSKVGKWLWKISRKIGLSAFANFLDGLGHTWLAKVLSFEWSSLILKWDPEKRAAERARTAVRTAAVPARGPQPAPGPKQARPQGKPARPQGKAERFRRAPSWSAADASLSNALA
jgi:hypothetical protein